MFNPFDVEFHQLEFKHLQELISKQIPEGLFIEYKKDIPKSDEKILTTRIGKSISSFANASGGWIFWGIETKGNCPSQLTGIEISEINTFEDKIAKIINSNVNPSPIYHIRLINNEPNRFIVVIQVEESPFPPYINSDGIIYYREHNESKPIKDRFILERLYDKKSEYINKIERFSTFELGETRGEDESEVPNVEFYLFPIPYNHFSFKAFNSSSFFNKVKDIFFRGITIDEADKNKSTTYGVGLNSIYTSQKSLIIRNITDENMIYKTKTVELFENGNLKFSSPIHEFTSNEIPFDYKDTEIMKYLKDKYHPHVEIDVPNPLAKNRFHSWSGRPETPFATNVRMIHGEDLLALIFYIYTTYSNLLIQSNFNTDNKIGMRIKINNCWRRFVVFDNKTYLDKIKEYNLPLNPKTEIEIPEFVNGDLYLIDIRDNKHFHHIPMILLRGIGLPDSQSLKYDEIFTMSMEKVRKSIEMQEMLDREGH
jgi:hypothetical protein